MTWDHDIHLYLRRATVHRQIYGQPAEHRDRVAAGWEVGVGSAWLITSNRRISVAFRARARAWIVDNLEPLNGADPFMGHAKDDADQVVRAKAIQRKLWDGGFAGLCYPVEYGGQGSARPPSSTPSMRSPGATSCPWLFNTPTLTIITPTLLDFGTEEQKQRYHPRRACGVTSSGCSSSRSHRAGLTWPVP